jgi:hypothetical protein
VSTRRFHIGEILTVTTGTYLTPTGLTGVQRLLRHLTGAPHMTHQIGRAIEDVEPYLREQFPWINEITIPSIITNEAEGTAFLAVLAAKYGEYHEVAPLPPGTYTPREPISEYLDMKFSDTPPKPLSVQQRVALLLVQHMLVSDDRPGGTIDCSCRHWDGQIGDWHSVHVAQKLAEASLLTDEGVER